MDRCRYRERGGGWKENGRSVAISHGGEAFPGAMGRPHSSLFYAIIKAMPRGQLLQAKKERMKPDEENCCDCYWC